MNQNQLSPVANITDSLYINFCQKLESFIKKLETKPVETEFFDGTILSFVVESVEIARY